HPDTVVGHRDLDVGVGHTHGDGERAAVRKGVAAVAHQIEQQTFEVALAALHGRQLIRQLGTHANLETVEALLQHVTDGRNGAGYVAGAPVSCRSAGEAHHSAENSASDLERELDPMEILGQYVE